MMIWFVVPAQHFTTTLPYRRTDLEVIRENKKMDFATSGCSLEKYVEEFLELYHEARWEQFGQHIGKDTVNE